MATPQQPPDIEIPTLPVKHDDFIQYVSSHPKTPMAELVGPFKRHDAELRKVFAQWPRELAKKYSNVVPVFAGHEQNVKIRARNLDSESDPEKESYIMPLKPDNRKADGSPAIVQSLRDFKAHFNVFTESSLVDMDWSNVVAAGSAVVTSLLDVPDKYIESKKTLREYYHNQIAPASDVDLFLYGLTEEQAIEKIKQIERKVRDALLVETTVVRTKHAVTIASQYPVRHVQIVLRLYKSISEILTGFDVDCSCAAYDGNQVYASPRALAAYMTQINTIDITRRSPSYENRLSKYAHRGFEIYWPNLDRSRIDPTIFERSFGRTEGLARLLVLEKLPSSNDRDNYMDQRRRERGRPSINRYRARRHLLAGNIKDQHEDEVAEWVDSDEVSDYHTFTIPYGPKFHARKIEKLLYTKDLLLNAEWNRPKDRDVDLHRHPAFFGSTEDIITDCCGHCPQPSTVEEEETAEEENKIYISGDIEFIKDDPGRQTVGSFHPLSPDDWTNMAYVGNTARLCQAIVDRDLDYVQSWVEQEGNDLNTRDYTGRAPLHLAVANSSLEVIRCLIDHGARLIARLVDGKTALHLAAIRGDVDIISALLKKSEANEEEEDRKIEARRASRRTKKEDVTMQDAPDDDEEGSDVEMVDNADTDTNMGATTENSMVNIESPTELSDQALTGEVDKDEPDVYDINVVAWDTAVSPLHLAIAKGHVDVVKCLVQEFGADVLLPIKLSKDNNKSAILPLVLASELPFEKAKEMVLTLIQLGASCAQADMSQTTAFHYLIANRPDLLEDIKAADETGVKRAIDYLSMSGNRWSGTIFGPLTSALSAKDSVTAMKLLDMGARPDIDFTAYMKAFKTAHDPLPNSDHNKKLFRRDVRQPVMEALQNELPSVVKCLLEQYGVDPNTLAIEGYRVIDEPHSRRHARGMSLLDEVQAKLKTLREGPWKAEEPKAPLQLKDDLDYLASFTDGSYSHWSANVQLDDAKRRYKYDLQQYKENLEKHRDPTGVAEKQRAIDDMIREFEEIEACLIAKHAKKFYELYPDIEEPDLEQRGFHNNWQYQQEPFGVVLSFKLGDLDEETHQRYVNLFEAAWDGDLATVKELTLVPWKSSKLSDEEDEDQPPLQVSVQDRHDLTPFSIAVLRGHLNLATAIMEIASAQWADLEQPKKERFKIDGDDEGVDDSDSESIHLYSEIVDDTFTIENIGEVSLQVKSKFNPLHFLSLRCPAEKFVTSETFQSSPTTSTGFSYLAPRRPLKLAGKRTNTGSMKPAVHSSLGQSPGQAHRPSDLFEYAISRNDSELLTFLINLGQEQIKRANPSEGKNQIGLFTLPDKNFLYCLAVGRPHLAAEMIRQTGAGIGFEELTREAGVEIKEKAKFYQGLSVYGKKRKDWAARGRGQFKIKPNNPCRPPLLEAAHLGSLESVEWLMSDAPLRCYKEFVNNSKDDERIQKFSEIRGFESYIAKFLEARSDLAIHCCIMGDQYDKWHELLRYLTQSMPSAIETKSEDGYTPLHLAFQLQRPNAAKILIEAGADQTCRDKDGKNLLHSLLSGDLNNDKHIKRLEAMLNLIDKRLLENMFHERCSGSLTPLAFYLNGAGGSRKAVRVMEMILGFSKGQELSLINGEGDSPLHVVSGRELPRLVNLFLQHDPTLVNRENATGQTPFEIAEDALIGKMCNRTPPMPGKREGFWIRKARRYGLSNDYRMHVLTRNPTGFVETAEADRRLDVEKVWDMIRDAKSRLDAEGLMKRKLVTLNEANEVARRLPVINANSERQRRYTDEQPVLDEVQLWLGSADLTIEEDQDGQAT